MALEWKHFRETIITLLRVISSAFSLFSRPWCIFGASIFPDVLMRSVWGSICSLIDLPRGFGVVIKTCTAAHVIIKQKFKDLLILRWVGKTALYVWSILCVCVCVCWRKSTVVSSGYYLLLCLWALLPPGFIVISCDLTGCSCCARMLHYLVISSAQVTLFDKRRSIHQ